MVRLSPQQRYLLVENTAHKYTVYLHTCPSTQSYLTISQYPMTKYTYNNPAWPLKYHFQLYKRKSEVNAPNGQTDSHHQTQHKTNWRTWPTMAPDHTKRRSPAVLSPAEALQPFLPELEAKILVHPNSNGKQQS